MKLIFKIFFFIYWSGAINVYGNDSIQSLRSQFKFDKAIEFCNNQLDNHPPDSMKVHLTLAGLYLDIGNTEKSLHHLNYTERWIASIQHDSLRSAYLFLKSAVAYNSGNYNTSLDYLQKAKNILLKSEHVKLKELARITNEMGEVYFYGIGNSVLAKKEFTDALEIKKNITNTSKYDLAISLYNMGVISRSQDNFKLAREYALAAYENLLEHPYKRPQFEILCQNLIATIFASQGNYPKAIEWGERVVADRIIIMPDNYYLLAMEHFNLAKYYLNNDDLKNAARVNKVLEYYLTIGHDNESENYARYLRQRGEILYAKKDTNYLNFQKQAISVSEKRYSSSHWLTLNCIRSYTSSLIKERKLEEAGTLLKNTISTCQQESNFSAQQSGELAILYKNLASILIQSNQKCDSIVNCLRKFDRHMDIYRKSSQWNNDKIVDSKYIKEDYNEAISELSNVTQCERYFAPLTMQFIEKSKAILLWESFIQSQLFDKSNLPDSIQLALTLLESEIKDKEAALHETDDKNTAIIDLDLLKNKRQDILESLKTNKLSNSPYLTGFALPSLKEVQSTLNPQENIINFLQTDSILFALLVNTDSNYLFKFKTGKTFNAVLDRHINNVYNLDNQVLKESYKKTFIQDAHLLYQTLDTIFLFIPKNQKIIIIPDGQISLLPFGSLLSANVSATESYRKYPYLIHDYQFSYAYSASIWSVLQEKEKSITNIKMAAFGPLDNAGLSNAQKEIDFLGKFFKSETFNGSQSGKTVFLENLIDEQNIHLAIHGKSDTAEMGRSFLSFGALNDEENKLYDYEIVASRIEAPLLVMNACETAIGKNYAGEGVLSLSRSMVQAGCKNVVSSLWQVNDEVGFTLMKDFYKQLNKGKKVSRALHIAKTHHLSSSEEILAHPYFWASLVHTGNDEVSMPNRKNKNIWWLLLIFLPIIGVALKRK